MRVEQPKRDELSGLEVLAWVTELCFITGRFEAGHYNYAELVSRVLDGQRMGARA